MFDFNCFLRALEKKNGSLELFFCVCLGTQAEPKNLHAEKEGMSVCLCMFLNWIISTMRLEGLQEKFAELTVSELKTADWSPHVFFLLLFFFPDMIDYVGSKFDISQWWWKQPAENNNNNSLG